MAVVKEVALGERLGVLVALGLAQRIGEPVVILAWPAERVEPFPRQVTLSKSWVVAQWAWFVEPGLVLSVPGLGENPGHGISAVKAVEVSFPEVMVSQCVE